MKKKSTAKKVLLTILGVLLALVIGGRSLGRRVLLPYLVSILLILPLVLMT